MQTHRTKPVRYLFTFIFCGFSSLFSYGQSVGVRTTTPQTLLDVNGSVAFREGTPLSIGNGNNHNSVLGDMSFYRITAPTAAYAITGFSGGVNGRLLCLANATVYEMILKNLQSGSISTNQIQTGNNIDVVVAPSGVVTLIYNSGLSKWIVLAHSGLYLTQIPVGTLLIGATTDEILTTNGNAIRKLSNLSSMKGVAQYVIKSADESLTSSTTLQDDDALQFTAEANTQYEFFAQLYVDGSGGHIKYAVDIPSGSLKIDIKQWREVGNSNTAHQIITADNTATTEQFDISSVTGITNATCIGIITIGATAGTVKVRWAQRVSDVVTIYMRQGSFLKITKI